MFYEMSKPYNEKYIIVFKYFCSFIGLRFNLKKTFQQKDSVYAFFIVVTYTMLVFVFVAINERQSLSGFGVSYSTHSIPGLKGASHEYR